MRVGIGTFVFRAGFWCIVNCSFHGNTTIMLMTTIVTSTFTVLMRSEWFRIWGI